MLGFNPIFVDLIFDNFLWGGASDAPPPLKSAIIELEKILRHIWKALKKSWGVSYILKMPKMPTTWLKTSIKNQTFF